MPLKYLGGVSAGNCGGKQAAQPTLLDLDRCTSVIGCGGKAHSGGFVNYIRRFKSYYGLRGAEEKLKRWLMDFDFMDLRTADGLIDWKAAPIVEITPSLCSATNLRSQS